MNLMFNSPFWVLEGASDVAQVVSEALDETVTEDVQEKIGVLEQFFQELPQKALGLGIRVVLAIVFFVIGVQVIKLIRKILKKSLDHANADVGVIQFLDSFVKMALYVILVLTIATSFGLDAASVVAVVGSAGVAVGLALQGSLSNFAGGVLILLLKPFKVGDYIIEDTNKNEGTVTEIQLFYTKLTTPDERIVVLPNGTLANASLTNVTSTYKRRLTVKVGISYDSDLQKAKALLLKIVKSEQKILTKEEITVFVDDLADSAVIIGFHCYVANDDYWTARSNLLEEVKLRFDKEGIEIPYPQLVVHKQKQSSGV